MDEYIITGVETKPKGKVKIYLWNEENPTFLELDLPHIIPSKPLSLTPNGARRTLSETLEVLAKLDLGDVKIKTSRTIKIVDSRMSNYEVVELSTALESDTLFVSSQKRLIQLAGPASMKAKLYDVGDAFEVIGARRRNGTDSRNNVSRIHKLQVGWPFSLAKQTDFGLQFHLPCGDLSTYVQRLCNAPADAFDTEFEGWEPKFKFDTLDVATSDLRSYARLRLEDKIKEITQNVVALNAAIPVLEGQTAKQAMAVLSAQNGLVEKYSTLSKTLDCIDDIALTKIVSDCKFEQEEYQPFALCYVAGGDFPNFYFTTYRLPEKQTIVTTEFGDTVFENIVVESKSDLEQCVNQICQSITSTYAKKIRQYVSDSANLATSPANALRLLSAATKRARNALITGGHNIDSYDYPNMRGDRKNTPFLCGIGGAPPKIDAQLGFFVRSVEPGRHNIDTCLVSQKYFAGSKDNKLKTFIQLLFGYRDIKDLTYDETTKKRVESGFGNEQSSLENAIYCMKDTVYHYYAMDAIKRSMILLSILCKQSPEVVGSTSYKRISGNLIQLQSLAKRGCYVSGRFGDFTDLEKSRTFNGAIGANSGAAVFSGRVDFDDFDIEAQKNSILLSVDQGEVEVGQLELFGAPKKERTYDLNLRSLLKNKTTFRGCVDVYYLTPFVNALMGKLESNEKAKLVLDELTKLSEAPQDRVARYNRLILAQGLQRDYLGKIVHCALNFSKSRGVANVSSQAYHPQAYIFEKLFDMSLEDINNNIVTARRKFQEGLLEFQASIIDSRTLSAISVPGNSRDKFRRWMQSSNLGSYFGEAKILSPSRGGRFILCVDGDYLGQGIDIKFARGLKTLYDAKVMSSILDAVFVSGNFRQAINSLVSSIDDLMSGAVPVQDLLYTTNSCAKDPNQYSARSLTCRQVWHKVLSGVSKGQEFSWGYTEAGVEYSPGVFDAKLDLDEYRKVMFGEQTSKKWNFKSYSFEKVARVGTKTSKASTTCGSLIETLFVYNTADVALQKLKRAALTRVVKLEHSVSDLEIISSSF